MKRISLLLALALMGCAEQPGQPARSDVVATVRSRPSAAAPDAAVIPSLHTTVSGRHIADVSRDVQGWHDMQHTDCRFVKVVGAEVVSQDAKAITEYWTIEACKQLPFTYKVLIIPGTGALTDAVSNVDDSPLKASKP